MNCSLIDFKYVVKFHMKFGMVAVYDLKYTNNSSLLLLTFFLFFFFSWIYLSFFLSHISLLCQTIACDIPCIQINYKTSQVVIASELVRLHVILFRIGIHVCEKPTKEKKMKWNTKKLINWMNWASFEFNIYLPISILLTDSIHAIACIFFLRDVPCCHFSFFDVKKCRLAR